MVFRKAVGNYCLKNLANKFLLIFILLLSLASKTKAQQIALEGPELNSVKGLSNDFTRQCRVDADGAIWICHNQGLQIFPSSTSVSMAISSKMKNISTWDVAFYQYNKKSYTAVISFDSGLYLFNDLGQLSKRINLKKTRALHWVKNKLYCLSSNGVFQIRGSDTLRMTPACESNEQISSFFFWRGTFYACTYPSKRWIHFRENENAQDAQWENRSPWPITHSILCQKATDSLLYLGSEGAYYVIDKNNETTQFNIGRNKENNWTVWSIEQCVGQIYLALGNVHNLERGALIRHNPSTRTLHLSTASKDPFLWGLTYDSARHVLWAASLGKGSFTLIYPNNFQLIPYGNIYSDQGLVCIYNEHRLYLKNEPSPAWTFQDFPEIILDVQITANRLFILTKDWIYEWNKTQNSFQPYFKVSEYRFNKLIAAGYSLILHRPYGEWSSINILTKQLEQWPYSSKQTSQFVSSSDLLITQEFNGSLHLVDIKNRTTNPLGQLGINTNTPLVLSNNKIWVQSGDECEIYQLRLGQLQLLYTFNISEILPPNQDFKIFGTPRGFWILSNTHLYRIILLQNGSIQIADQEYLGLLSFQSIENSAINSSHIWFYQSGCWKSIPFPTEPIDIPKASFFIEHQSGDVENLTNSPVLVAPWNDINIKFAHPSYWTHYHSLISIGLKNKQDSFVHRQVRFGQIGNWLPGVPAGDYALYLNHQTHAQVAFLKTNTKSEGLAIAIILILVITSTLINFRDQSITAENQLISLRWKTLKSNLNPHFLHNSMGLIQSLIAQTENKKAIEVTGKIAEINRLFLETNLQEVTSIQKELEFCRKYIQIESMRFSDKAFTYEEKINPKINLDEWKVPPLLFQPVIENCIKHGLLLESTQGALIIAINPGKARDSITIEIANSGPGPSFQRSHGTQMGSELVKERLEHFNHVYADQYLARAISGFDPLRPNWYVFSLTLEKT